MTPDEIAALLSQHKEHGHSFKQSVALLQSEIWLLPARVRQQTIRGMRPPIQGIETSPISLWISLIELGYDEAVRRLLAGVV